MNDPRGARCLGEELGEYVTARLEPERRRHWDLHLVTCRVCAHAVDEERRLQAVFAGAPSMPGDLRATLLALAGAPPPPGGSVPDLAVPPTRRRDPLRVLAPGARPCHRSALRATAIAAAAASASAAAALGLTVISAPVGATVPTATTSVPVLASPTPSPYSGVAAVVPVGWGRTGGVLGSTRQAQSRP